jgi:hypothetical protein
MNNHAYLIIAHEDPRHLQRLIEALDEDWAHFYIHLDRKSNIEDFVGIASHPRVKFVQERVAVYWGGWSQVQATLNTLEAAASSRTPFSYYTLLSGSHYPIRGARDIYNYVENNSKQYINIVKVPHIKLKKGLDRFTGYFFEGWHRPKTRLKKTLGPLVRMMSRIPLRNPRRHLDGLELYAGSQWWTLSSEAIDHILDTVRTNPKLTSFFHHVRIPDESFFQTILGNSSFLAQCARGNVYTDWSDPKDAPCFIRSNHLRQLLDPSFELADDYGTGPVLYARKFGSKNLNTVQSISNNITEKAENIRVS